MVKQQNWFNAFRSLRRIIVSRFPTLEVPKEWSDLSATEQGAFTSSVAQLRAMCGMSTAAIKTTLLDYKIFEIFNVRPVPWLEDVEHGAGNGGGNEQQEANGASSDDE